MKASSYHRPIPSAMAVLVIFAILLIASASLALSQPSGNAQPEYKLKNLHRHPWFPEVLAAACVGWMLGLVKGLGTTKDWLGNYWKRVPSPVLLIGDLFLFGIVGGYIGIAIYNPDGLIKALAAGITWPVGLGVLSKRTEG